MVTAWGLKAFVSQEALPLRLQAVEVFLLEVGLSLLLVPPDVDLLVLLYMSLDVLILLEVVAFGQALLVLLPMLPVLPLVVMEVYLKG